MKGVIGNLSSGKTVLQTMFAVETKGSRKIISNYKLFNIVYEYQSNLDFLEFYAKTIPLPEQERIERIREKYQDTLWLIDEIGKIVPSRKITWTNDIYTDFLTMLGKINCEVIWTSQLFTSQVDKIYRSLTHELYRCTRCNKNFKPILSTRRIINEDIYIMVEGVIKINPPFQFKYYINPKPYFKYFNTKELIFVDFKKLDQIKKMIK